MSSEPEAGLQREGPERSGRGELATAFVGGASAVVRLAAKSPLKLVVSRERGPCARVHAATFGGGLLAGDAVTLDVAVGALSTLALGTSAPAKVYRSDDGRPSTQALRVTVGEGGLCALVPAPLTCFEGARYTQRTEIDLAAGASLVLLETLTSGRAARGERWRFERFDARTRLRVDGRLLLQEAVRLEAGVVPVADRFGAFNAFSVAVLVGPRVARAAEALRESLAGRPAIRGDSVRVAVSPLAGGVVVRAAAAANEPLEELWKTLLAPALAVVAGGDDWRGPW